MLHEGAVAYHDVIFVHLRGDALPHNSCKFGGCVQGKLAFFGGANDGFSDGMLAPAFCRGGEA